MFISMSIDAITEVLRYHFTPSFEQKNRNSITIRKINPIATDPTILVSVDIGQFPKMNTLTNMASTEKSIPAIITH